MKFSSFVNASTTVLGALFVTVMVSLPASAQDQTASDQLSPQFTAMNKEASLACALLLPGNVPGVPNMMDLCGGRYAFKIAPGAMLESQLLLGKSSGQSYYLGSFAYRGDMALNDLILSVYGGLDILDANQTWYMGVHAGGAIWWELTDTFFLRTDAELQINPGTSLLLMLSAVLRFDSGGGGP